MDGVVKVKSKVGKGTTFKIELVVLCTLPQGQEKIDSLNQKASMTFNQSLQNVDSSRNSGQNMTTSFPSNRSSHFFQSEASDDEDSCFDNMIFAGSKTSKKSFKGLGSSKKNVLGSYSPGSNMTATFKQESSSDDKTLSSYERMFLELGGGQSIENPLNQSMVYSVESRNPTTISGSLSKHMTIGPSNGNVTLNKLFLEKNSSTKQDRPPEQFDREERRDSFSSTLLAIEDEEQKIMLESMTKKEQLKLNDLEKNIFKKWVKGLKILIVNDEHMQLMILRTMMTTTIGIPTNQVLSASNGHDAYEQAIKKDSNFDIIIMDLNMPVMNGMKASKLIIAHHKNINAEKTPCIIALSSHMDSKIQNNCKINGIDHCVICPLKVDWFNDVVLKKLFQQHLVKEQTIATLQLPESLKDTQQQVSKKTISLFCPSPSSTYNRGGFEIIREEVDED